MGTCALMNCTKLLNGPMALICDEHKAWRRKDCAQMRSGKNYNPGNPDCTYGGHQSVTAFGRGTGEILRTGELIVVHQDCTECHYCGLVHPWTAAA